MTTKHILVVLITLLGFGEAAAQIPSFSVASNLQTAADPIGVMPNASTDGTAEQIDLSTGALTMFIPVLSLPQRGGSVLNLGYTYSSRYFDLYETINVSPQPGDADTSAPYLTIYDLLSGDATRGLPWDSIIYAEDIISPPLVSPNSPLQPNLPQLQASLEYYGDQVVDCLIYDLTCGEPPARIAPQFCVTNWTFTDWGGTKHIFITRGESSPAQTSCTLTLGFSDPSLGTGLTQNGSASDHSYVAGDASGLTLNLADQYDATVTTTSGTVYHFPSGQPNSVATVGYSNLGGRGSSPIAFYSVAASIIDKNGNRISISGDGEASQTFTLVDTMGRKIIIGPQSLAYLDSNGTPRAVI